MARRRWQLQEAKARLSELVQRASEGEVQVITRRGRETAVLVGADAYRELTALRAARGATLLELLAGEPVLDDLPLERDRTPVVPADLF